MSASFPADYYDGVSSARRPVVVHVEGGMARIVGEGLDYALELSRLAIQPRLGSLPLRIGLPGNGLLVAKAEDAAGALEVPRAGGLAHRLESHLGVILGSIAGLAVAAWFGYHDGIPWLAREVAYRLPPSVESELSTQGLQTLDRTTLAPSALPRERQAQLEALFARVAAPYPELTPRLHLRDGRWLGANAFALPGGAVIVTDRLVRILGDDEHVEAVMAHEIGHLRHRHGSRQILQASATALVSAAVLGDVGSVAGLAATVPTVVLHSAYTRDFEREADRFAFEALKADGRSPRLLGESLQRLEKARDAPSEEDGEHGEPQRSSRPSAPGYLSTHPATAERIEAAEEASK